MIESRKNRYLKDIRRCRRRKGEHAILEGPHLVAEALAARIELDFVLATPEFLATADRDLLARLDPIPQSISAGLLEEVTDADSPRGILALARRRHSGANSLPLDPEGIYLYIDGVQHPGNLGAIARAAEATGVTALALSPSTAHPNHSRALRASAGSLLRLPVAIDVAPAALSEHLSTSPTSSGTTPWVALSPSGDNDLYDDVPSPPLVLVVGAERGLQPDLAQRCDTLLRIPMAEPVDSLNTAVATALALFEIRRHQRDSR